MGLLDHMLVLYLVFSFWGLLACFLLLFWGDLEFFLFVWLVGFFWLFRAVPAAYGSPRLGVQ